MFTELDAKESSLAYLRAQLIEEQAEKLKEEAEERHRSAELLMWFPADWQVTWAIDVVPTWLASQGKLDK